MPLTKYPTRREPAWNEWDRKAQKEGLRQAVYAVNGDKYTGEWSNNLKHGKGTQIWKRSQAIYEGDWKEGERSGFGTYSVPDPVTGEYVKVYAGFWKYDMRDGYGTNYYSPTEYYEGDWKNDQKSGWGRMYYTNGDIFEGEWFEDKQAGHGMFQLEGENRYEGSWKNGKKHGPGKYYYLNTGQLYEGLWIEGIPKAGTMIDFGREEAPFPTVYPIPQVKVIDPSGIVETAQANLLADQERSDLK